MSPRDPAPLSFAMCAAFPRLDYYETSAPPEGSRPAAGLPATGWLSGREGGPGMVPTFTTRSIGQGGAQLYPRQHRRAYAAVLQRGLRPAKKTTVPESVPPQTGTAHCTRPRSARFRAGTTLTGRQPLVHSRYTF